MPRKEHSCRSPRRQQVTVNHVREQCSVTRLLIFEGKTPVGKGGIFVFS